MFKKIISYLLLLSFGNLISGCYSEQTVSKEKLKSEEVILAVVLPSGKAIKFDENGGHYKYETENISGTGINGLPYRIDISGIKQIRTKIYPVEPSQLVGRKIIEVITTSNKQIIFDRNGGFFDKDSNLIKGNTVKLGHISGPISDISFIYVSNADTVSKETLKTDSTVRVKQVVKNNGFTRTFNDEGGRYHPADYYIEGKTIDGEYISLNPEKVLYTIVRKSDALKTTFAVIGVVLAAGAVAVLIYFATKQSCPFIYSFDEQKYVFDAEPLGGATSKGLKRTEYSRLEYLKETEGKYKLKVVNEVAETQYIDEMSLYIVDHPVNTEAVMNNDGKVYLTGNVQSFVSSTDENGKDISRFLSYEDGVMWQTKMPVHLKDKPEKTHNQLTVAFKKPAIGNSVDLIINAGTTLWGSNMIKEMLSLYGNQVDNWYDKIDQRSDEYYQMMNFLQREELYELKLYLKEKTGWVQKGIIQGGGPFISERRVIPLDISQIEGDTLFLRVNPPCGFWSFDYLAIEYGKLPQTNGIELFASTAIDYKGIDITRVINKSDEDYYIMPETGNLFEMEFNAPEVQKDMRRTVFLKSSGYYKIHLPKANPPDFTTLFEIGMIPGKIIEYSYDKYIEWWNTYSFSNQ